VPIYEFVCEACGRLTEVMQRMNDPAPATCPECGEHRMARTVSRTSFQLKGGGWYADLYASKKEKPASGEKPGAGGEAAGGSAAGGEKPAASGTPAAAASAPSSPAGSAPASTPAASASSGGAAKGH